MASNQDQHVVYQPNYRPPYQPAAAINVWNQPPTQTIAYGYPMPQGDIGPYAEKTSYGGYPPLHYQAADGTMIRAQHFDPQFAQPQWQYQQPGTSHFIPTYATNFNAATDPAYGGGPPQMNRVQPPNLKSTDFPGWNCSIGMMENPAHTAAAYTANWVSSTSSIPPEMREEPEGDVPMGQWIQNNSQWTGTSEDGRYKGEKGQKREKRDEPRELTFDERLEKARMQKDRVENQGLENNANGENGSPTATLAMSPNAAPSSVQQRPSFERGRGRGRGGFHNGGDRRPREHRPDQVQKETDYRHDGAQGGFRGKRGGGMMGAQHQPAQMVHPGIPFPIQQQHMFTPQNPGYMFAPPIPQSFVDPNILINAFQNTSIGYAPLRRVPLLPGPFGMIHPPPIQQDIKFRNTWLDAQNYQISLSAMMSYDTRGRGGYRGRGRGSYPMRGGVVRRFDRREEKKDEKNDEEEEEENDGEEKEENVNESEKIVPEEAETSSKNVEASSDTSDKVPKENEKAVCSTDKENQCDEKSNKSDVGGD